MMQIVTKVENPTSETLQVIFEGGEERCLPPNGCLRNPEGIFLKNLEEIKKQGASVTFNLTEIL